MAGLAGGFTLIELLVVIAVTGILAGMLLPAMVAGREKARRTTCLDNLKQMAIGLENYVGDYAGYYPCWPAYGGEKKTYADAGWDINRFGGDTTTHADNVGYWEPQNRGVVLDPKSGLAVATGGSAWPSGYDTGPGVTGMNASSQNHSYEAPVHYFRTIYVGDRDTSAGCSVRYDGNEADSIRPDGEFTMAPTGLGYLLAGGYMKDAKSYFCPTAAETMPSDNAFVESLDYREPGTIRRDSVICKLSQLQAGGGFGHMNIAFGNWKSLFPDGWTCMGGHHEHPSHGGQNRYWGVVQSNYNYRNVPAVLLLSGQGIAWPAVPAANIGQGDPTVRGARLRHVMPAQKIRPGEPVFKTPKQLAGRALVSDSFSQPPGLKYINSPTPQVPGMGQYAHRDGYNVLYGDWSAKWYGDSEQRILWWPSCSQMGGAWKTWDTLRVCRTARNIILQWRFLDDGVPIRIDLGAPYNDTVIYAGPTEGGVHRYKDMDFMSKFAGWDGNDPAYLTDNVRIWHIFDQANGYDVDIDEP